MGTKSRKTRGLGGFLVMQLFLILCLTAIITLPYLVGTRFYVSNPLNIYGFKSQMRWYANRIVGDFVNNNWQTNNQEKSLSDYELNNSAFYVENTNTGQHYTNTDFKSMSEFKAFVKADPSYGYVITSDGTAYYEGWENNDNHLSFYFDNESGYSTEGVLFCMAVNTEIGDPEVSSFYLQYYNEWTRGRQLFIIWCIGVAVTLIVMIVAICMRRSRRLFSQKIAGVISHIWIEAKAIFWILFLGIWLTVAVNCYHGDIYTAITMIPAVWCFLYYSYIDLRFNKSQVFKQNIINSIIRFYHKFEMKYPFQKKLKRRFGMFILAWVGIGFLFWLGTLLLFWSNDFAAFVGFMFVLSSIGLLIFAYLKFYNRYCQTIVSMGNLIEHTSNICAGNYTEKLSIDIKDELSPLAYNINEIQAGVNLAVEQRIASEKMKVELITNVSHDIKTPLTSILNYIDLLSKEELTPDYANDYVKIVGQKSSRLKGLVEDLFDISKANSGNIEVNLEPLELSQLLSQTLAELEEQFSSAGVEVKCQFRADNVMVIADGKKLNRVFENLLINAVKYSLAQTRIYIEVTAEADYAYVVFKNIANYEMNFTPQDITERFVRGDQSRTSEGSGLGLAIALSFLHVQGGDLKIEVDGDMFKAIVKLKRVQ